ncbi:hypothetical protein glysoja_007165, partial [Glycine soja]
FFFFFFAFFLYPLYLRLYTISIMEIYLVHVFLKIKNITWEHCGFKNQPNQNTGRVCFDEGPRNFKF